MSATFDIPGLDAQVDDRNKADDLFGYQDAQLPAAPRPDAFASYVPLARYAQRGRADTAALIRAATSIGELTGADGFYRFPAGDGIIEGPSIELAKSLANRWGAVGFGLEIDSVEDDRVTVIGVCVDFATLVVVRRPHTFTLAPPPAKFAKNRENANRWQAMQIQANGARALRGAIFDCLPSWYWRPAFEAAKSSALKAASTLKAGQTIETARDEAVKAFGALKVTRADLEALLGAPYAEWSLTQIGELRITMQQIRSGDLSADDLKTSGAKAEPADASSLGLGAKAAPAAPAEPEKAARKSRAPKAEPKPAAAADREPPTADEASQQASLVADVAAARKRRELLDHVAQGIEHLGQTVSAEVVAQLGLEQAVTSTEGIASLTDEQLARLAKGLSDRVDQELAGWGGQ